VAAALPATVTGIRVAGDMQQRVETVAVVGGAGDDLFAAAAASGADAYVTSDLRHHPASEERAHGRLALVDVPHWAGEWPWLPVAAARLVSALEARGATVSTSVSTRVTDPWTTRLDSGGLH
jgi:putative NIF3 family GTP cyclohydrolase 1 type 2